MTIQRNCVLRLTLCSAMILFSLSHAHAERKVTTVAGGAVNDGKSATSAVLTSPHFAVYDHKGNLYIADYFAHRIREISTSGIIKTIAGNGISGFSGDNGKAKAAMVSFPTGITVDAAGNIYFSDDGNNRVRKIDTNGVITTIAGNGTFGFFGDGGPATSAELAGPYGLAFDTAGNLYIADNQNERVRVINPSGVINTFAGNGTAGFGGDGGSATAANLNFPMGLVADSNGNVYIADFYNNRVRIVNSQGTINTFAGNGTTGCKGDGGPATLASMGSPGGFVISGNSLLIATGGCSRIRTVDLTSNIIGTLAGSKNGYDGDGHTAGSSEFLGPRDVLVDPSGDVVIVDRGNDRVRTVNSGTQIVQSIAGGFTGDGLKGTDGSLNFPYGINFDSKNNLYIADSDYNRVRELSASGIMTTLAGTGISGYTGDTEPAASATLFQPQSVAADATGNVFIGDQFGEVIREVSGGTINTISQGICYGGSAPFCVLYSLATDSSGNVYGADAALCAIWKITPAGVVSLVAGEPDQGCGYNSDGIPATSALLNFPSGVALDSAGDIYIADQSNNRVRKVDHSTGLISTVAGNGTAGFSGDNGPATAAMLNSPWGVAVDHKGNLYIADFANGRLSLR